MGFPYYDFAAAAALYLNPGVTKEEFAEILKETHFSPTTEYSDIDAWDSHDTTHRFHEGLKSVAEVLTLPFTSAYEEFCAGRYDKNGLLIQGPYVLPDEEYKLIIQEDYDIESETRVSELSWGKLVPGDKWEACMGSNRAVVVDIIHEEKLHEHEESMSDGPQYKYEMIVKPIVYNSSVQKYPTLNALCQEWPQFLPENVFDFSEAKGKLYGGIYIEYLRWKKEGDKYFLDETSFHKMPAQRQILNWGYTDFILTTKAVSHKAWKMLSYRGLEHMYQFLKDFPDALQAYNQAIWDGHTSQYAKQQEMTNAELMRMRILGKHHE